MLYSCFLQYLLTVFLAVAMEGVIGKYGLPFLSVPFLISVWLVILASRQFTSLEVSNHGIYTMNEMYGLGGISLLKLYTWFNTLPLSDVVKTYFKSLGAILFQYHLLPGIFLATGLLIYSRISFLLSLIGFFSAYLYYQYIGASFTELSYGFIGFNFILTAIAIGGFFIIPSRYSFLWVFLLTPVISIFLTSTNTLFSLFQLSIFSLPFNLVALIFLYIMKFRERFFTKPEMVGFQQYSPEKNLYAQLNYRYRFGRAVYYSFALPFIGEWKVTQGHNGKMTHQGEWKHAWDFEIVDEEGRCYSGEGRKLEDYYSFSKPVIAPADGWIEEIHDGIDDNEPGLLNLQQNWGNSIVIKHGDQLYSKLSHLKKGTFKVSKGSPVKKGDIVASCGNSGRSPVPHIHFQIQATPFIGSKTLEYPIGQYIQNDHMNFSLHSYGQPDTGQTITNISRNSALENAFHFIPGEKFAFMVTTGKGIPVKITWEVQVNASGTTYIYCEKTGSRAYYGFNGEIHYFTYFEGDRKSLLYYFFLGAYKVSTGFYKDMILTDEYPLSNLNMRFLIFFQDFIAPFHLFMKSGYSIVYLGMKDDFTTTLINLRSTTTVNIGRKTTRRVTFDFEITRKGIEKFIVNEKNSRIEATLAEY